VATEEIELQGVILEVEEETGKSRSIRRIRAPLNR
jgi:calcineurin-like phosphoesterase